MSLFSFLKKPPVSVSSIEGSKCVGCLGLPGSGKSLYQTETFALTFLLSGVDVYCSYWINWAGDNFHFFSTFEEIKNLRNCVVIFDELAQFFDPRDWEREGQDVRRFFQLHRHRHVDIYFNTQDISLVAKTVGIVADEWILCQKIEPSGLIKFFFKFFGLERLIFRFEYLTYQQLKKMAMGWDLAEEIEINNEWKTVRFDPIKLLHHELDDKKQELIHWYCPLCLQRQYKPIPKGDVPKGVHYCPKHKKTPLEVRETGLYDTDYEPDVPPVPELEWQAVVPSPKGFTKIKYRGPLSVAQLSSKPAIK